jgi:hypothetical protein
MLSIERASVPWKGHARAFRVILDGKRVGSVRDGQRFIRPVPVGPHLLRIGLDWGGSPEVAFWATKDATVEFECSPVDATFDLATSIRQLFDRHGGISLCRLNQAINSALPV